MTDVPRCGNCDENIAALSNVAFCSGTCKREAMLVAAFDAAKADPAVASNILDDAARRLATQMDSVALARAIAKLNDFADFCHWANRVDA